MGGVGVKWMRAYRGWGCWIDAYSDRVLTLSGLRAQIEAEYLLAIVFEFLLSAGLFDRTYFSDLATFLIFLLELFIISLSSPLGTSFVLRFLVVGPWPSRMGDS